MTLVVARPSRGARPEPTRDAGPNSLVFQNIFVLETFRENCERADRRKSLGCQNVLENQGVRPRFQKTDISEFESSHPSHGVGSLRVMRRLAFRSLHEPRCVFGREVEGDAMLRVAQEFAVASRPRCHWPG
jgi:hypothetical protein